MWLSAGEGSRMYLLVCAILVMATSSIAMGGGDPSNFSQAAADWATTTRSELHGHASEDVEKAAHKATIPNAHTSAEVRNICVKILFCLASLAYAYTKPGVHGGYSGVKPSDSETQAETNHIPTSRDGRWDAVKFYCMAMVVLTHLIGFWWMKDMEGVLQCFMSRLDMPGFTFVSGVFSASGATLQLESGSISVSAARLKRVMRDYVLGPNLTVLPLYWAAEQAQLVIDNLMLPSGLFRQLLGDVSQAPLISWPYYWYLGCLFLWQLLVPMLLLLKSPLLVALSISMTCKSLTPYYSTVEFLPYFVLGFVVGGGGLTQTNRQLHRQKFEAFMVDGRTRMTAIALMMLAMVLCNQEGLPEPINLVVGVGGWDGGPVPWRIGGFFTYMANFAYTSILILSFVAIVFWLPTCEAVSDAGSRTLNVYLLHGLAMDDTFESACAKLVATCSQFWQYVFLATLAIMITFVFGSQLSSRLTHHFVQPQWLLDALQREGNSHFE